jgi:hypothetical protein
MRTNYPGRFALVSSFALALLLIAGCSSSDKKPAENRPKKQPVAEADVPKAVVTAFTTAHPSGKATQWWARGTTYSLIGQDSGKWVEIKYGQDGALQEEADEIAVDSAPDAVKTAFNASPYAKMTFVDAVKRNNPSKDPKELYKFVVTDGTKPMIVVYGTDGKLVKDKPFDPAKFEKWKAEHTVKQ